MKQSIKIWDNPENNKPLADMERDIVDWVVPKSAESKDSDKKEAKVLKYTNGAVCLFCEMPEQSKCKPEGEFVCSRCAVRFVEMTQDELKQGVEYLKANREKLCLFNFEAIDNKIKALEIFIGEEHEQRKPIRYNQRATNGKRTAGSIRHKERIPRLSEARTATSLFENRQRDTALSSAFNNELVNGA